MESSNVLFTSAEVKDAADKNDADMNVKDPRIQLKNMDTIAAKLLDPWGVSVLDDVALDALWLVTKKGDKHRALNLICIHSI